MNEQTNQVSRRFFLSGMLACGLSAALSPRFAYADQISDKQAEAAAALQQLELMQGTLDRASNDYYRAMEAQETAQTKMDDAQAQIDRQSAVIDACQDQLGTRARSMYRSGQNAFLDVLLGSTTFEEFATNWDILNSMNETDAQLVEQSKDARETISQAKAVYAVETETAQREADRARAVQQEAMSTVSSMASVYDNLSAEAADLVAQKQAAEATVSDKATLEKLAEEGAAAAAGDASAAATTTGSASTDAGSSAGAGPSADGSTAGGDAGESTGGTSSDSGSSGTGGSSGGLPESDSGSGGDAGDTGSAGSDLGTRVVNVALEYLGWAYVWGGKSPSAGGFDCSGFVSYCYSQAGSSAPSYTGSLISWGYGVSTPQPGDVCVIHQDWDGGSQHTGIYYGNGQMIHASTFGVGVIIGRVQSGMVYRRSYDA